MPFFVEIANGFLGFPHLFEAAFQVLSTPAFAAGLVQRRTHSARMFHCTNGQGRNRNSGADNR